jgi:shikimate dehydrogenase
MNIRGTTQLVGLLGWPVEHTLSPPMHNAAFAAAGLDWVYVPLPTAPERLADAVRGLVATGFRGCNVTIPHKEAVIPLLDEVTPEARAIGAVNTVVIRDGKTIGHNTDVDGFVAPVCVEAAIDLSGKSAVVLGCGGAARAIATGCLRAKVATLTLTDIDVPRMDALARDLAALGNGAAIQKVAANSDDLRSAVAGAQLVANATPLGMHGPDESPIDVAWLPQGVAVFDAIYTQPKTALLAAAEKSGGKSIHGLRMLLHQGVKAFALWTGVSPDVAVMERALAEARNAPAEARR